MQLLGVIDRQALAVEPAVGLQGIARITRAHRCQLQSQLEQPVGLRLVGFSFQPQQALGIGEQVDRIVRRHRRRCPQVGQELPQQL